MAKVILDISGAHCGTCATTVAELIKSKAGVISAIVDYGTRKAEVEYDPGKISIGEIIKAVEGPGLEFHASEAK